MSNAQKYCTANVPKLTIQVRQNERAIEVDFIDNGNGIRPEDRQVIFEKFSRLGDSDGSGAGLGLAICAEIMGRLGGRIEYLADIKGTAFRVTLPKKEAMAAQ